MTKRPIPLNFFGMPFGLVGLADVWLIAAEAGRVPRGVGDALLILSAAVWLLVTVAYLDHAGRARSLARDLTDPAAGPFASLCVIVPMVIAANGLYARAPTAGRVLVDVFLVLTVLLGAWFTGQWIYGRVDVDRFHPGYFLPTVAGGLLAAASAGAVGQQRLGQVMFGLGAVCWMILGSVIMGRLLFRPLPPPPLLPTLAIEVAPAAVASLAYFKLFNDSIDAIAAFLGGYGLLMVLAQLRLLPAYLKLPFMPSTWAFTFSWAAVAAVAIHWVERLGPPGAGVYTCVLLGAITVLIGGIAARTLVALARGQLPPAAPPPQAAEPRGGAGGPSA
ncbi:TDT family transporter [Streptomyces sp. NPDC026673]|uniref:SLAC1 family transporter n=1 Tax=Streptomyces sp. NPDC026673 TaxID=3155724 RepID=UPI0033D60A86